MLNDETVSTLLQKEKERQQKTLQMIPSENYASPSVLNALGSVLNNKYSEGYPKKRYYQGNAIVDEIETLAIERAKQLFGVSHANVQPYSGSPANQAVYFALLEPMDKVMGMHLSFGGNLTHGWKVNFSGRFYQSVLYTTDKNGFLNYDELEKLAQKEQPKIIFCGGTAYPRLYDYPRIGEIAKKVNAYFVADISHEAGLIAGKAIPSPVGHADIITTTTHKTLRVPRGAMILCDGEPSSPMKAPPPDIDKRKHLPTLIDRAIFPGLKGGPHNHSTAGIAIALGEALTPEFQDYAKQILKNAKVLAETLMQEEIELVTGGTENHLMIIDLIKTKSVQKEGMGRPIALALEEAGIISNCNAIPFDPSPPFKPSGVRIGTPSLTTRGMKETEMREIASLIANVIKNYEDQKIKEEVKKKVEELCKKFPIYLEPIPIGNFAGK